MAIVKTYTIPDQHIAELVDVFGQNYIDTIIDINGTPIPNPQTKANFASEQFDREVRRAISQKVRDYRQKLAAIAVDTTEILE
jgi:hypothetical protein